MKTQLRDDTGALVDVLCVKGSGWDLDTLEPRGLPAVRLASLAQLRERSALSDEEMVNAQRTRLLDASAPNPSVETLLHAFLPAKFVDHSHADAVLALANQPNATALCREVFGETLAIVPYVMPGFALAKLAAEHAAAQPSAHGLLLLNHGLFTFGATARESYERHIDAVDKAERFIATRLAALGATVAPKATQALSYTWLAPILRGELSGPGAAPRYVLALRSSRVIESLLSRADLEDLATRTLGHPDLMDDEMLEAVDTRSIILRMLQTRRFAEFHDLFDPARGVPVAVVTFVAMLELARETLVQITQAEPFAPIYVRLSYLPS